jgi:acyl-CoA synthetase (AMP-forming)/AMP-acid ligase II
MSIIDCFDRGWRINPRGAAYIQDGRRYSFQKTGELSCRIANALLENGYGPDAKGAVWADNDVDAWICVLGLWRAGMAHIPVDVRHLPEENQVVLDAFDCDVVFFQEAFAGTVNTLRPRLPRVGRWVCIDANLPWAPSLAEWSEGQPGTPPRVDVDLDDVAVVATGDAGAGMPRGALLTHRALQAGVAQCMIAHPYRDTRPVHLAVSPLTHPEGMLSLPCTAQGGTVVVVTAPDAASVLDAIRHHKVTELFMRTAMICRLLECLRGGRPDVSSLRYFLYRTGSMSATALGRAIDVFGPVMAGVYNGVDAAAPTAFLAPGEHAVDGRSASVGRPGPLVHVEIMNDRNEILARGETGEICMRGDVVMKGYYKAPHKTAETIVDGWFHTGDIGHVDGEGYLHVTDRKKDVIISGSYHVCASEIEQVIWTHPAVQDCAVIGVPDDRWGEAAKAVIELNAGQSVGAGELIDLCRRQLGFARAPRSVDVVAVLPRNDAGMVSKRDLRERYRHDKACES